MWLVVSVLAVTLCIVALSAPRTNTYGHLSISRDQKTDLIAIPRADYGVNPWIDVTLPGGRQVTFPVGRVQDKAAATYLKDHPLAAGVVTQPSYTVRYWQIGGLEYSPQIVTMNGIAAPTVFGKRPQLVKLARFPDRDAVSVVLPGNGKSPGERFDGTVNLRGVRIRFKQRQMITPMVPIAFDISVLDAKKGERYAVDFGRERVLITGGKAVLHLSSWAFPSERVRFKVTKVSCEPILFRSKVGSVSLADVLREDRTVIAKGRLSRGSWTWTSTKGDTVPRPWLVLANPSGDEMDLRSTPTTPEEESLGWVRRGEKFYLMATLLGPLGPTQSGEINLALPKAALFDIGMMPAGAGIRSMMAP